MYAIINAGDKQFRVSEGDLIKIEKIEKEVGDRVNFKPLLVSDKEKVSVDEDDLKNIKVCGEVMSQTKGKKIIVFKKKRRKNYSCKTGSRQLITEVKITEISTAKEKNK